MHWSGYQLVSSRLGLDGALVIGKDIPRCWMGLKSVKTHDICGAGCSDAAHCGASPMSPGMGRFIRGGAERPHMDKKARFSL